METYNYIYKRYVKIEEYFKYDRLNDDFKRYSLDSEGISSIVYLYDNVANTKIIENIDNDPDFYDKRYDLTGSLDMAYMLLDMLNEENIIYLFLIKDYVKESNPS